MMGSFGPLYVGSFSCASGSSVSDPSELLDAALFSDAEDSDALSAATRRFAAASSCASVANAAKGSFVRVVTRQSRSVRSVVSGVSSRTATFHRRRHRAETAGARADEPEWRRRNGGSRPCAIATRAGTGVRHVPVMRPRTRMAFSWNLRPAGSAVMRPSPGRGEAHSPTTSAPPAGTSDLSYPMRSVSICSESAIVSEREPSRVSRTLRVRRRERVR